MQNCQIFSLYSIWRDRANGGDVRCIKCRVANMVNLSVQIATPSTLSSQFFFIIHRLVSGSFDKTVRIWSLDGKMVHKLDGFLSTVTGICYVPWNKTIWAAGGTSYAYLYDPKSGDNVSRDRKFCCNIIISL